MASFRKRDILVIVLLFGFRTSNSLETKSKTDNSLDVPLLDSLEAPLKAQIDITNLTKQLRTLITNEVKNEVNLAYADLVKSLVEKGMKKAKDTLKTEIYDKIKSEESVGFTAFGSRSGSKSLGTILKFPIIKSSFGMSSLDTLMKSGKFTCEKSGLYFVSTTVMAGASGDCMFSLYKDNTKVSEHYIGKSVTATRDYNSGTATILLHLDINDTVYIKTVVSKMYVYDMWTSFTALKVK